MMAGQWSEKISRRTRCKKSWVRRCTRRRGAEVGGGGGRLEYQTCCCCFARPAPAARPGGDGRTDYQTCCCCFARPAPAARSGGAGKFRSGADLLPVGLPWNEPGRSHLSEEEPFHTPWLSV